MLEEGAGELSAGGEIDIRLALPGRRAQTGKRALDIDEGHDDLGIRHQLPDLRHKPFDRLGVLLGTLGVAVEALWVVVYLVAELPVADAIRLLAPVGDTLGRPVNSVTVDIAIADQILDEAPDGFLWLAHEVDLH